MQFISTREYKAMRVPNPTSPTFASSPRAGYTAGGRPPQKAPEKAPADKLESGEPGGRPKVVSPLAPSTVSVIGGPTGAALQLSLEQLNDRVENLPVKLLRPKRWRLPFTDPYKQATTEEAAEQLHDKNEPAKLVVRFGADQTNYPVRDQRDLLALEEFTTERRDGPLLAHQLEGWSERGLEMLLGQEPAGLYPAYVAAGQGQEVELRYQGVPLAFLGPENDADKIEANLAAVKAFPQPGDERDIETLVYLRDRLGLEAEAGLERIQSERVKELVGKYSLDLLDQVAEPVEGLDFEQKLRVFRHLSQVDAELGHSVRSALRRHSAESTEALLKAGASAEELEIFNSWPSGDPAVGLSDLIPGKQPAARAELLQAMGACLKELPSSVSHRLAQRQLDHLERGHKSDQLLHQAQTAASLLSQGADFEVSTALAELKDLPPAEQLKRAGILDLKDAKVAHQALELLAKEPPANLRSLLEALGDSPQALQTLKQFGPLAGQGLGLPAATMLSSGFSGQSALEFAGILAQPVADTSVEERFEAFTQLGLLSSKGALSSETVKKAAYELWTQHPTRSSELGQAVQSAAAWKDHGKETVLLEVFETIKKSPGALDLVELLPAMKNKGYYLPRAFETLAYVGEPNPHADIEARRQAFTKILLDQSGNTTNRYDFAESLYRLYADNLSAENSSEVVAEQVARVAQGLNALTAKFNSEQLDKEIPDALKELKENPVALQAGELLPTMSTQGYHVDAAIDVLRYVSEPLGETTPAERIDAYQTIVLNNLGPTTRTYVLAESLFKIYRARVEAGADSSTAALETAELARGMNRATKDFTGEQMADRAVPALEQAQQKLAQSGAFKHLRALAEKGFAPEPAVELLARVQHEVGGTTLDQRFQAVMKICLEDVKKPLNYYEVIDGVYDLYRQRLEKGESESEVVDNLRRFALGLQRARQDDLDKPDATLAAIEQAERANLPAQALGQLNQFSDKGFHLQKALLVLEGLSDPIEQTTFAQRYQAFEDAGLLDAKGNLTIYDVILRGQQVLNTYLSRGLSPEEAAASLRIATLGVVADGVSQQEAMQIFESAERRPIPEFLKNPAINLRRLGNTAVYAQLLVEQVATPTGNTDGRQRLDALAKILGFARQQPEAKVTNGLALGLYQAWTVLVERGGEDPARALQQLAELLQRLDDGRDPEALGRAIFQTIDMTVEEQISETDIEFGDDHIVIGDIDLPIHHSAVDDNVDLRL